MSFKKLPTEEELTPEALKNGYYMSTWRDLPNHRCIKCPFSTLSQTEAELHYFYKHVMNNTAPSVIQSTRPAEAKLVGPNGAPITEIPIQVEGKSIQLPAGYTPPETVIRHLEQAAEGPADNQTDGSEPRFKRR